MTAVLAAFTLIGGVLDLLMLYKLRPFDGNLLFVDHPTDPVCEIYAPSSDPDAAGRGSAKT